MSLSESANSDEETLEILLRKTQCIFDSCQHRLRGIEDRKGGEVIVQRHYTMKQVKPEFVAKIGILDGAATSNLKPHEKSEDLNILVEERTMKSVSDLIKSWKYGGETLEKEKIVINGFLDLTLVTYDDVISVHTQLAKLHETYSRILIEHLDSRAAVCVILNNMEKVQTAIEEIHMLTVDVPEPSATSE